MFLILHKSRYYRLPSGHKMTVALVTEALPTCATISKNFLHCFMNKWNKHAAINNVITVMTFSLDIRMTALSGSRMLQLWRTVTRLRSYLIPTSTAVKSGSWLSAVAPYFYLGGTPFLSWQGLRLPWFKFEIGNSPFVSHSFYFTVRNLMSFDSK
jgi:hypothetical protein